MNIQGKIYKLIKALEFKGYIYLINKEQVYSRKKGKVFNKNKLFYLMPVEEYNEKYPDKKKDTDKYDFVKVEIFSTFRKSELLLKLVEIYKKVGEISG